jgi:hypothetical protein
VFLARSGSREDLLAALDQVQDDTEGLLRFGAVAQKAYLECRAPFQEQEVHVRAFVFDFMIDFAMTVLRWVERTRAEVDTWSDLTPEGKSDRALAIIGRWQELHRYLDGRPPPMRVMGATPHLTPTPLAPLATDATKPSDEDGRPA